MTDTNVPDVAPRPIFFAWARSFWAFLLTIALILTDAGAPAASALGALAAMLFGWDRDAAAQTAADLLPLLSLVIAAHQRSGAARPYTVVMSKETLS